ncbi:alpha/beta-hydrolase [Thozetella sp. PMI_491]|nr:alpha/beta-hydrolase [Thozetella sp. PMI_491]
METRAVQLDHKPGASLKLSTFFPPAEDSGALSATLVVFLNGLMTPRDGWFPAIDQFISLRKQANQPVPPILTYDRYGQGESDPDPTDIPGTPYGHDAHAVVDDLHLLLKATTPGHTRLVLVCNSIGCPLARLFAAKNPGIIAGFLFLDSMVANSDYVSLLPDPKAPGFDPAGLPEGVSLEDLVHARETVAQMFLPTVPNKERLDRRNFAELLPESDKPELPLGPGGQPAQLTVVGHDWDEFANQNEQGMKVPKAITNTYINPKWGAYNAGLARLLGEGRPGDLKTAPGCGHFIQRDDPVFVANELNRIIDLLS